MYGEVSKHKKNKKMLPIWFWPKGKVQREAEPKTGALAPVLWHSIFLFLEAKEYAIAANLLSKHLKIPKTWQEKRLRQLLLYLNQREEVLLQLRRRHNWMHFRCKQTRVDIVLKKTKGCFSKSFCCRDKKKMIEGGDPEMIPGTWFVMIGHWMVNIRNGEIEHEFDSKMEVASVGFRTFLGRIPNTSQVPYTRAFWVLVDLQPEGKVIETQWNEDLSGSWRRSPTAVSPSWIATESKTAYVLGVGTTEYELQVIRRKDGTKHFINVGQLIADQKEDPTKCNYSGDLRIDEDRQLLTMNLILVDRDCWLVLVHSLLTQTSRMIVCSKHIWMLSTTTYKTCQSSGRTLLYDVEMGCLLEHFPSHEYYQEMHDTALVETRFVEKRVREDVYFVTPKTSVRLGEGILTFDSNPHCALYDQFTSNERFMIWNKQGTLYVFDFENGANAPFSC
jgi:hypothetical protein